MIGVVVPAYKAEKTILACVESVLKNEYVSQVIVVENGAKDNLETQLRKYIEKEQVIYRYTSLAHRSHARNIGAKMVRSKYVAFVDSDVVLDAKWTTNVLKSLNAKDADGGQGKVIPQRHEDNSSLFHWIRNVKSQVATGGSYILLNKPYACYPMVATNACIYRKDILEEVDYFDDSLNYCEDIDLSRRVALKGGSLISCEQAIAYDYSTQTLIGYMIRSAQHAFYKISYLMKWDSKNIFKDDQLKTKFIYLFLPRCYQGSIFQRVIYFFDGTISAFATVAGVLVAKFRDKNRDTL